jgi:SagB-type dehydrogenase family enzyme
MARVTATPPSTSSAAGSGDTARTYHELSSMSPDRPWDEPIDDPRVVQGFAPNDFDRWPQPAAVYPPDLPTTPLPRELPASTVAATEVLAGRPASDGGASLDLPALARLLYLSAGVVRVLDRPGRPRMLFRAAGSAGARFPLDVYLVARGVQGVPDGVHWYDPLGHALVQVGPAADGVTTLVVTGVPWRTSWRYAERGYRHLYWDAGTMLAQNQALALSAGLPWRLYLEFPDAAVSELVGADGLHTFPLAVVALEDGPPATTAGGPAAAALPDETFTEFPLVAATQHAGDVRVLGAPEPELEPIDDRLVAAVTASAPLDDVILRRGSTRLMLRGATLPRATFDFAMATAVRGVADPQFVAVHGVDGIEPGLYRWPDLSSPLRAGDLRDELTRLCLYQDLGGDAAFVVLSCADIRAIGDRAYRSAQLRAGLVEGRLHLAAYALGAGASGMTFYDTEIAAFVGEPLEAMIFTCVGVPEYANRAGGRPGEPASFRYVEPRESEPDAEEPTTE